MNLKNHRHHLTLFGIDLMVVLLAYGAKYRGGFGSDTLGYITDPVFRNRTLFEDARFLASVMNSALYRLGFVMTDHYAVCFLVFILCIAGAVFLIQTALLKAPPVRALLPQCNPEDSGASGLQGEETPKAGAGSLWLTAGFIAATLLPLVNVLFTEHFMFTECFLSFGAAYLLSALAVKLLAARAPSRAAYAGAFALLLASSMCYQNALIFAAMVIGTYLVLADDLKFSPGLFGRTFVTVAAILSVGAVNLGIGRLLALTGHFPRIKKEIGALSLAERLDRIFSEIPLLLRTSLQLLPALYLPLCIIALCVAVSAFALFKKRGGRRPVTYLLFLIMQVLLFLGIPVLSGSGLTPRVAFTFYVMIGMLAAVALSLAGQSRAWLPGCAAVLFLTVQMLFCNIIWNSSYMVNRQEILDAKMIVQQIEHYEEKTGTTVRYLSYIPDAHQPHHFPDIHYTRDQIGERTMPLAMYSLLEYVTGRVFDSADMDEEIRKTYFEGRDWNALDLEEQLVIRGDTAYFCIY